MTSTVKYKIELEVTIEMDDHQSFRWIEDVIGEHLSLGGGESVKVTKAELIDYSDRRERAERLLAECNAQEAFENPEDDMLGYTKDQLYDACLPNIQLLDNDEISLQLQYYDIDCKI